MVRDYTFDVYGQVSGGSGSTPNEFDFAGQQSDGSTGLQYLRARYYDPATGVFISRDPLAAGPGWLGNPHGYASASPAMRTDPWGLYAPNPTIEACEFNPDSLECMGGSAEPIAPGQAPKILGPGDVLAGIGSIIGEYLRLTGDDAVRQYHGTLALNQMLLNFFPAMQACAADFVCAATVTVILSYLGIFANVHPGLKAALLAADGLWTTYSGIEQQAAWEREQNSGRASPIDQPTDDPYLELEGTY